MGAEAILGYCAGVLFIASSAALSKSIGKLLAARAEYEEAERCLREARRDLKEVQAAYVMVSDALRRSIGMEGGGHGEV